MKKKAFPLRTWVTLAFFVAINILLTRIFVLYITDFVRLDLGNIPLILSGLFFGPLAGALTGAASDLLGVMISGRGWYPPLTLGPLLMGFIPGLLRRFVLSKEKKLSFPRLLLVIGIAELLAAILWKSYWLSVLYSITYPVCLAARAPAVAALLIIESIAVFILYRRIPTQMITP